MKALVTGGGGFLGKKIVQMLLERGDEVTVLGRSKYPDVEAMGAKTVQLDISKKMAYKKLVRGWTSYSCGCVGRCVGDRQCTGISMSKALAICWRPQRLQGSNDLYKHPLLQLFGMVAIWRMLPKKIVHTQNSF